MVYFHVQGSLAQWQTVFFLSAGIYAATDLFYVIFGTGVEQPWNKLSVPSVTVQTIEVPQEGFTNVELENSIDDLSTTSVHSDKF